ncbi:MAG: hypothetical protein LBV45_03165 [Xanthomonadaceae bacterium]|nr:hypothetical protein [Xanthomonadaceae bacterium]
MQSIPDTTQRWLGVLGLGKELNEYGIIPMLKIALGHSSSHVRRLALDEPPPGHSHASVWAASGRTVPGLFRSIRLRQPSIIKSGDVGEIATHGRRWTLAV